jgi:quinoprotein glucose dehydrogenase
VEWTAYGHDEGGSRYSPLAQVTPRNVGRLKVAWVSPNGDFSDGSRTGSGSAFEATPLMVAGTLYVITSFSRVLALDPQTGAQRWAYDPKVDLAPSYANALVQRGVATWVDPLRAPGRPCHRRIFLATLDAQLIALDARTGRPCADFGKQGQVDLSQGVGAIHARGDYSMTSPPAIDDADGLVIVGPRSLIMGA